MATTTIGSSSEFHHESEKIGEYLESVKLYSEVNGIRGEINCSASDSDRQCYLHTS